jgi:hypothetical protein
MIETTERYRFKVQGSRFKVLVQGSRFEMLVQGSRVQGSVPGLTELSETDPGRDSSDARCPFIAEIAEGRRWPRRFGVMTAV